MPPMVSASCAANRGRGSGRGACLGCGTWFGRLSRPRTSRRVWSSWRNKLGDSNQLGAVSGSCGGRAHLSSKDRITEASGARDEGRLATSLGGWRIQQNVALRRPTTSTYGGRRFTRYRCQDRRAGRPLRRSTNRRGRLGGSGSGTRLESSGSQILRQGQSWPAPCRRLARSGYFGHRRRIPRCQHTATFRDRSRARGVGVIDARRAKTRRLRANTLASRSMLWGRGAVVVDVTRASPRGRASPSQPEVAAEGDGSGNS
jgi:hypothetical protein